jgi:hypothetical protein
MKLLLPTLLLCASTVVNAAPTTRATDFTEALAQAKSTGNDIVVLQRGSDWNRAGETMYQNVWLKPEFIKALGDGFVLVTVDRPEQTGAPAIGSSGDHTAVTRLNQAIAPGSALPANEISQLRTKGGATFKRRPDGTLLVDDAKSEHNPATDTLEMSIQTRNGGRVLRFDFLPDPSLPGAASGRAANGNFAISEIEIKHEGKPLAVTQAWASHFDNAMPPSQLIDGIGNDGANGWNSKANERKPRTLLLVLPTPVRAGATLNVNLVCLSKWGQHVPGCLRAAVLEDNSLAGALAQVVEAQTLARKNAAFTWWDGTHCPRVALVDSDGRAIAADDKPRGDLTPTSLAERVKKLREKRETRDEWLAKAEGAQGPEKAEFLRQALEALAIRNWPGNGNCYKIIHDQIKAADPKDVSGVIRWLGFSTDPKGGVPWAKPAWNEAIATTGGKVPTDADYHEALARVDKELADPRNKILSHENIQRMMVAKFHIYKKWKGHEEQRFQIQQEIAAFDPTTFWGIGANGYVGMYGKSPVPYLTYGWKANQVKPGINSWKMTDTAEYFDHPGSYKILLTHAGGASKLKVKRIALLDGDTVVAEASPNTDLGPGPLSKVETTLDFGAWKAGRSYTLLAELEAAVGQTNSSGTFSIEPWLIEPTTPDAASSVNYAKVQEELQDKLNTAFSQNRDALEKSLVTEAARKHLAYHELLHRCEAATIQQLAQSPGGPAFIHAFSNDVEWMESFLANDNAKWPLAIENLRLLHANAREIDHPLYRKVATAIALAAGNMNRYRMLDRFQAIVRTHRAGLLHASFDDLDTREMRWAVMLNGNQADYQFFVDRMQMRMSDYVGACHQIAYIDPNVYGYSVQGWGYVNPWTHHYGPGFGERPFRAHQWVGGVCGTLSGFGTVASRAHGVMATTVGQPAHCAYIVRTGGNNWATGNDVSGPETNGFTIFEGTGFPTMHGLYETIHADRKAYRQSCRLAWAAHVYQERKLAWTDAWSQAVAAQPINYPLQLEGIKALEATPGLSTDTWQKIIVNLATSFAPHHEAGWALINRCYAKAAPAMKPEERMALLLQCHQQLKQSNAPRFMGFNLTRVLNTQADSLGDPRLAIEFMKRLLVIHYSPNASQNRVFGEVMKWGSTRFAGTPATASAYATAIGTFFSSLGDSADTNQMKTQIMAGIEKSSDAGDLSSHQLWTLMAAKLLPPLTPQDVHLTPAQLKAAPTITPLTGDLLGKNAILQTSSSSKSDRPLSYQAVLDGTSPGWFDTNAEAKPWAQVLLAGEAEITGIVAVNRYEFAPTHEEFKWAAPFKVLVSTDGKTWTEVATCDKAEAVMRIDLAGKAPRAKYIRLERQAPADASKPPGRFHLRNFLVYGRKLY